MYILMCSYNIVVVVIVVVTVVVAVVLRVIALVVVIICRCIVYRSLGAKLVRNRHGHNVFGG